MGGNSANRRRRRRLRSPPLTDTAVRSAPAAPRRARAAGFRPDVQALRAVAILAVLLNHLWPLRLTGGYVGVDVFFVISGYLITAHLLREVSSTGRIALGRFYARRVRRLLPAALLVLLVSAVATFALLPYPRWERTGAEILASATYVENWFLSAMSVNYSALNDLATPAQHYWSLSVEEQFYLVWPLLLLGVWRLARRRSSDPRKTAAIALGVLVVVSLGLSAYTTAVAPSHAYFVTYTRAWEFGIGGLIALLPLARLPRVAGDLLSIGGFAGIAVAAVMYGPTTPFPGVTALLPVLGTAAVILAGTGGTRLLHTPLTSWRPVQWFGDVSYSLYLWHWPLIVLVPFLLSGTLSTAMKLGIIVVALVLADFTRRFVEVPGQRWSLLQNSSPRTFAAMLLSMALVAVVSVALIGAGTLRKNADVPPATVTVQACVGPQSLESGASCDDPFDSVAEPVMGPVNAYFYTPPSCSSVPDLLPLGGRTATVRCDFSAGKKATAEVWLVGDSHAEQWKGPILDLARARGWVVTTSFGGGCPVTDAPYIGFRTAAPSADRDSCRSWAGAVQEEVVQQHPDIVFTSSAGRVQLVDDGTGRAQRDQFVDGLVRAWTRWADAGTTVIPLGGVPFNGEVRDPNCLVLNRNAPLACAVPAEDANPPDPYLLAADRIHDARVRAFDASPYFCAEGRCYAAVGGIATYYDADHLNLDYVRRLAPMLAAVVDAVKG
ncbi:acyltransferase family protein [Microbacterium sp. NPDC057650]|uniref:acyltransferase family protein n=1 Tax=unclassified Microbacterium TaxID=2609290 RepID=UPI00366DF17F